MKQVAPQKEFPLKWGTKPGQTCRQGGLNLLISFTAFRGCTEGVELQEAPDGPDFLNYYRQLRSTGLSSHRASAERSFHQRRKIRNDTSENLPPEISKFVTELSEFSAKKNKGESKWMVFKTASFSSFENQGESNTFAPLFPKGNCPFFGTGKPLSVGNPAISTGSPV